MKKHLLFFCSLVITAALQAQIIHVPGDYTTIQQGINAANPGDTVLVAEGTYYGQINFKGKKPLMVASQFLMDGVASHIAKTIIDGSQLTNMDSASVVYFVSGEDSTSILCGFTIQHGKGTHWWWDVYENIGGAGIFITHSTATIRNNIIRNNELNDTLSTELSGCCGGGIHASYGTPGWIVIENNKISDNKIITNHDWAEGGGVYAYCTNARVANNEISANISKNTGYGYGATGGLHCAGDGDSIFVEMIIQNNLIENNEVRAVEYGYGGGLGLWFLEDGSLIQNNMISYNKNDWIGGGIDIFSNSLTTFKIESNYFIGNEAMNGGAIDIDFDSTSQVLLINNIFNQNTAYNQGGAIWINRSNDCPAEHMLISINNSFSNNHADSAGGAIYTYEDNPLIFNSIFWENTDLAGNVLMVESGTVEIAYSDLDTNKISGEKLIASGMKNADPLFSDTTLLMTEHWSPCVDKGAAQYACAHGTLFLSPPEDILGNLRPVGAGYDMGAYDIKAWGQGVEKITNYELLISNWPNPFTASTTFRFTLKEPAQVNLQVFNSFGQLVAESVNAYQQNGDQKIEWNSGSLPAGIYYYRIQVGGMVGNGKMVKK
jgi:hypothetical protein